jgi:hypothetical protein
MFSEKHYNLNDLMSTTEALTAAEAEQINGGVMQDPVTGRTCTDPIIRLPYPKPQPYPYPFLYLF